MDPGRAGNFAGCPHDYADTVGKDHGRIAIRHCWTTGDPAYLDHSTPTETDATWPVWSGSSPDAAEVTGSRLTPAASFPAYPQGQAPTAGGAKAWKHRKRSPLGPGRRLWRGRQLYPHGPRRPQHGHPQAHCPQPATAGSVLRAGIANKRLAAVWNKDYLYWLIGLKPEPILMQLPGSLPRLPWFGQGPPVGSTTPNSS